MNSEQQTYIDFINRSSHQELYIKKTGREGISLPVHMHDKHQIIYTLSGTLRIQIGATNYFIPEQHLAWIPRNVEHELSSNNRQISLLIFYVALDLPEEDTRQQFGVYNTNAIILENLKFISSAEGLIRESEQPDLYLYALSFFRLLPAMSQSRKIPLQALAIPDDVRLHPVLNYITAHIGEDLKIEQVAHSFGFSVRNLSRLMLASGIRFSTYLNYQRITHAIELFADGDKTMQQIAYEVGFNTPNNFNRVFKQLTGINPSTFCHSCKVIREE